MVADTPDPGGVEQFLAAAYELATNPIERFDDAAGQLAGAGHGEVAVIATARRRVAARLRESPDPVTKQVAALIRRAFEVGSWDWERYAPDAGTQGV